MPTIFLTTWVWKWKLSFNNLVYFFWYFTRVKNSVGLY